MKYNISIKSKIIFLTIICLTLYLKVTNYSYINLDDPKAVFENTHIQKGINLNTLKWAFTTRYYDYWHPLTWITHMIDWNLYKENAGGHHLTNILFHLINTILLFFFVRNILKSDFYAFFIASIFSIHPMHIESVVWIVERKDVLSMPFLLSSLIAYQKYQSFKNFNFYILSFLFFLIGLMAKPMLITMPFLLLILDFSFYTNKISIKNIHQYIVNKIPFIFVSLIFSSFIILSVSQDHGLVSTDSLNIKTRIINSLIAYYHYLINFLFPFKLSIYHPYIHKISILLAVKTIFSLLLLSFLTLKFKKISIWIFWFMGSLLPVIGIIQTGNQAYANRFVYIPYIGLYISFILILNESVERKIIRNFILIFFTCYLFIISFFQLNYWKNSITLFERSLQLNSNSPLILNNLGLYYSQNNNNEKAQEYFLEALNVDSTYSMSLYNMGVILNNEKKYRRAVPFLIKAMNKNTTYLRACNEVIKSFNALGMDSLRLAFINNGLRLDSNDVNILFQKANYLKDNTNFTESKKIYNKIINISKQHWQSYNNLGLIYLTENNPDSAIFYFQKALKINFNTPEPWINIGTTLNKLENYNQSVLFLSDAIKLFPKEAKLYIHRAEAYYALKYYNKSKNDFLKATKLDTNFKINLTHTQ